MRLRDRGPEAPAERKALEAQPELDDAASLCVRAWGDLGTCRALGMTSGPIPWTAILAWADFHGLDHDATMLLSSVIRRLDLEHFEREESRRRQEEAKARAKR